MKILPWLKKNKIIAIVILFLVAMVFFNVPAPQAIVRTPQPTCDGDHFQNSCEADGCFWTAKTTFPSDANFLMRGVIVTTLGGIGCAVVGAGGAVGGGPLLPVSAAVGCSIGASIGAAGGLYLGGVIASITSWLSSDCYSCVPNNYITDNMNDCCSQYGTNFKAESPSGISLLNKDYYICSQPLPGDECSSTWQGSLATILDSIWKSNTIKSCDTKSFIVIGAIAGVILLVAI